METTKPENVAYKICSKCEEAKKSRRILQTWFNLLRM